ncbi:metallophosphoesterase [Rhizobium ruizarguesonis]
MNYLLLVQEFVRTSFVLFYQDHDKKRQTAENKPLQHFDPRDPLALTRIIDQSDQGLVVAEINSCAYVQKNTVDERRGQIHDDAVYELRKQLKAINAKALRSSIKIALIHHHPVVLPTLYDNDAGYDAVLNSELLLGVLKKYGFHLVLHGHKHAAVTYSYDAVSAWTTDGVQPLLIVAGGSAGSTQKPQEPGACNTYNVINIKWHPSTSQARINIETRGHVATDEEGLPLPSPEWYWKPLRVDDRLLTGSTWLDASKPKTRDWTDEDGPREHARFHELKRLRRNFPCIEIVPSLDKDQAYEGRLWLDGQLDRDDYRSPRRVEWAASRKFFDEIYVCDVDTDPQYRAVFAYYGPTLIQARLIWDDGEELAYIFAHFPREA